MGHAQQKNRQTAAEYAHDASDAARQAIEKSNECISAVNVESMKVAEVTRDLADTRAFFTQRLDAQGAMISGCEVRLNDGLPRLERLEEHMQVGRGRLDLLEASTSKLSEFRENTTYRLTEIEVRVRLHQKLAKLTFFGRFRWLFTGRIA